MGPGLGKVAGNQCADLLRLGVIGVVEPGRQHVGPDQDAALDLGPEAGGAGRGVHVLQVRAFRQVAQPVPHAVIAREVGRGFGRRDDVVGRQGIAGVRQADIHHLGPGILQPGDPGIPAGGDIRVDPVHPVFARNTDLLAAQVGVQTRFPLRHGHVEAG